MRGKAAVLALSCWILQAVFCPAELFAQCAMCWSALTHSPEGGALIRGFNDGILFLLLVPFLVAGAVGFLVYNAVSRHASCPWPEESGPVQSSQAIQNDPLNSAEVTARH